MIVYNNGTGLEIGASYMPYRTKPCLIVREGNTITKYATFNDLESAKRFLDVLADFIGAPKVDWKIDEL